MESEHPVVLGIDQATSCGYALLTRSGAIVDAGKLDMNLTSAKKKRTRGERFLMFERWMDQTVEQWKPQLIIYELPHFRGFDATMCCVGFVAIIERTAAKYRILLDHVRTQELKRFAVGVVDASKEDMTAAASKIWGRPMNPKKENDIADAIHAARWGLEKCIKGLT